MLAKYEKIKQDIIADIENGVFLPGDKIHSESNLKSLYNASNTTVVKALNDLVSAGYVIRRQGIGTFVRRNLRHRKVLLSELSPIKHKGTEKVEEQTKTKILPQFYNENIAYKLGSQSGSDGIIQIVQIASLDDIVWKIQNRFILAQHLTQEMIEHIENGASLSEELHLTNHMANLPIKMNIKVSSFNQNDPDIQPFLTKTKLSEGKELTLIEIERITYDSEKQPIEFTHSFIHPQYYAIEIISE